MGTSGTRPGDRTRGHGGSWGQWGHRVSHAAGRGDTTQGRRDLGDIGTASEPRCRGTGTWGPWGHGERELPWHGDMAWGHGDLGDMGRGSHHGTGTQLEDTVTLGTASCRGTGTWLRDMVTLGTWGQGAPRAWGHGLGTRGPWGQRAPRAWGPWGQGDTKLPWHRDTAWEHRDLGDMGTLGTWSHCGMGAQLGDFGAMGTVSCRGMGTRGPWGQRATRA